MKTTLSDVAFRNYIVILRIDDDSWMAFLQNAHYSDDGKEEVGRFYWYHQYNGNLSRGEVMELSMTDLFYDLEMLGT